MPDRRQGDRRESNNKFSNKKIEISLGTFIFIVLFVITVILLAVTSVVVGKIYYNKGYSQALIDMQDTEDIEEYNDILDEDVNTLTVLNENINR